MQLSHHGHQTPTEKILCFVLALKLFQLYYIWKHNVVVEGNIMLIYIISLQKNIIRRHIFHRIISSHNSCRIMDHFVIAFSKKDQSK